MSEGLEPSLYSTTDFDTDIYYLKSVYYYCIGHAGWNGDVITEINGFEVRNEYDLAYQEQSLKSGDSVKIKYYRYGIEQSVEFKL